MMDSHTPTLISIHKNLRRFLAFISSVGRRRASLRFKTSYYFYIQVFSTKRYLAKNFFKYWAGTNMKFFLPFYRYLLWTNPARADFSQLIRVVVSAYRYNKSSHNFFVKLKLSNVTGVKTIITGFHIQKVFFSELERLLLFL